MTGDDRSSARAALIATTLAGFATPFVDSSITVALPVLSRELSVDAVTLTWIRLAYLLSAAMFTVPFGKLADIYGRRRFFVIGTAIFATAALLMGFSTSATMLIATRVVDGIGGAMIASTGLAILTSVFPAGQRGRVLGINVAAVYLGLSLGPTIGGFLTRYVSWRSIFFLVAGMGLIVFTFAFTRLRGEWAEARGAPFDIRGAILYSVSLLALMFGITRAHGWPAIVLIVVGIGGLGCFAGWESRNTHPILDMKLLTTNRAFAFSSLAALINYSATAAVGFFVSLYLQNIKGLSPDAAGLVLVSQPAMMASFSPAAGWMSERIEPRVVASIGMALIAGGLVLLARLTPATPVWAIVGLLLLMGFGFALFSSPNQNAVMSSVQRQLYGVASGMLGTMRLVGQTLCMGITGLLFALYIGRVEIEPPVYPQFLRSMKTGFVVFAILCACGVFASLARGRVRVENDGQPRSASLPSPSDR